MEKVIKRAIQGYCLKSGVVRSYPSSQYPGRLEYSKSDFLLKLVCESDEYGNGILPTDLSKFMNGPKDSADSAKRFLLDLQNEGLIWLRVDNVGNIVAYKILV